MLDPKKEIILLLGMVFSEQLLPERGQEFRDRVRCIELKRLGLLPISWSSLQCSNWLSKRYCAYHKRTAIKEEICNWLSNHKRTAIAATYAIWTCIKSRFSSSHCNYQQCRPIYSRNSSECVNYRNNIRCQDSAAKSLGINLLRDLLCN